MIETIGLVIFACEQSLKEIVAKREDAMVSHDVTLLDVRRLRDSLRDILEVLYSLKEHAAKSSSYLQERREQMITLNDDKMAQLRSAKEERHKAAIDLGRLKVVLEKTKSKYMMVSSVNARKGEGEGYESPELKLILAAQRREELQREGDKLDATIQAKENDIKMMQRTLVQLKEMNTNYRSSFSRTGG
jgi:multidrug resistance efflux pump